MIPSPPIKQPSKVQSIKNNHLITIIPIILVITLSSSTVYFAYQANSLRQQLNNFSTLPTTSISTTSTPNIQTNLFRSQEQASAPIPTPDTTTNWKKITREFWRFKIPPNWHYLECNQDLIFAGPKITDDRNPDTWQGSTAICAFDGSPGTIEIRRVYKLKNPEFKIPTKSGVNLVISNRSNTIVDNKNAIVQIETIKKGQAQGIRWKIYIKYSPKVIDIITLHKASEKQTILDPFLSTFKFTNSTIPTLTPTPTPDYLSTTYTDKYFNYQISYNNKKWFFRRTFGPDIDHTPSSNIISGIDLHRGWPSTTNANININLLDAHGLTDTETWITKYELNPPLNSNKQLINFNNYPAVLYTYRLNPDRVNQEIYFITKKHLYHIYAWELGEKFGPEIISILDNINP